MTKARLAILIVAVLAAAGGATAYVLNVRQSQADAVARAPKVNTRDDLTAVTSGEYIAFRTTALGDSYGKVALVPVAEPTGARVITPADCDRVYAVRGRAVCLAADRGIVTTYSARILGTDWAAHQDLPLNGVPSRTRLSRDGTLVATTTFVFGHDYSAPGKFSTETLVSRVGGGGEASNVEKFDLRVGNQVITAKDRNMWGVTFADDDRFYATAAAGKKTWLVEGSLSRRTLRALREDAECPSLSPDGTRLAFKRRGDLPPGQWRLAIYDLRTGKETRLAEERSVDDQVEWLDDARIVYGLPRDTETTPTSDVWVVPADGTGSPQTLIKDAWSPAVVH